MNVNLISYTPDADKILVFTKETRLNMTAANFEAIKEMDDIEVLSHLVYMANTIPSSWEFVDYIFSIEGVSRAFTHQFVRNRTGSYAQQSMRVNDMSEFDYITGPGIQDQIGPNGGKANRLYDNAMEEIAWFYDEMIQAGVPMEDARGILPTNISTNIVAKYNLRTMSDLARSRPGGRTQHEFRTVFKAMVDCVLEVHPWAESFLFPKDREFFEELEEAVAHIEDKEVKTKVLKAIDHMRKAL